MSLRTSDGPTFQALVGTGDAGETMATTAQCPHVSETLAHK